MLLLSNKWYLYLSITKIPTNLRFVPKLYIYINLNWAEQQLFFFLYSDDHTTCYVWPPLASCCGPYPTQDDGAGLRGRQRNCTRLPPNTGQTTRLSESTSPIYISWPMGTPTAESKHRFGTSRPMSGQWNEKSQDSFVQTSPRPCCDKNVLTVSRCGQKRLLNALDVNANLQSDKSLLVGGCFSLVHESKVKRNTPITTVWEKHHGFLCGWNATVKWWKNTAWYHVSGIHPSAGNKAQRINVQIFPW